MHGVVKAKLINVLFSNLKLEEIVKHVCDTRVTLYNSIHTSRHLLSYFAWHYLTTKNTLFPTINEYDQAQGKNPAVYGSTLMGVQHARKKRSS